MSAFYQFPHVPTHSIGRSLLDGGAPSPPHLGFAGLSIAGVRGVGRTCQAGDQGHGDTHCARGGDEKESAHTCGTDEGTIDGFHAGCE